MQGSALVYPIAAFAGALLSFLLFNAHPAKIFMGDTGALAIGGFVALCAIELKLTLFLVIIAFVYVAEVANRRRSSAIEGGLIYTLRASSP